MSMADLGFPWDGGGWLGYQPQKWGAPTYHSIISRNISGYAAVIIEFGM